MKDPIKVAAGRLGGLARANVLTDQRRREIGQQGGTVASYNRALRRRGIMAVAAPLSLPERFLPLHEAHIHMKPDRYELCFFPEQNSFVRMWGGEDGLFAVIRQVTYRCGQCGNHFADVDMQKHFLEEKEKWISLRASV